MEVKTKSRESRCAKSLGIGYCFVCMRRLTRWSLNCLGVENALNPNPGMRLSDAGSNHVSAVSRLKSGESVTKLRCTG
jgi:hypothetical protein